MIATQTMMNKALDVPVIAGSTRGAIRRAFSGWYASARRDLPWRRIGDPYAVWVSEVMLQQTQVKTMLPYYDRFMGQFPTVEDLAHADASSILKMWEGLGYYSRARNLHKAARQVVAKYQGRLPDDWKALRALPGIGDYIASAVLSIAFDRPYAVVDGNVKRVLSRLRCLEAPVNHTASHPIFQGLADQLLCRKNPGDHNQAVMELGALICTPKHPLCDRCPVSVYCCAYGQGVVENFPKRRPKKTVPLQKMVAGVVVKGRRVLLVQRPSPGLLGGLWEFPNGPLIAGRDPGTICAGHIRSQINLDVTAEGELATVHHAYTHFKLNLLVLRCRWRAGRVRLDGPVDFAWVTLAGLERYPLHGAVHKALPDIRAGLV
jgi:A/G-specific adenine glycosylase